LKAQKIAPTVGWQNGPKLANTREERNRVTCQPNRGRYWWVRNFSFDHETTGWHSDHIQIRSAS
jgi:hypothetical protein